MSKANLKVTRVHHRFQPKGVFQLYAEPSLWKGFSFETGLELSHVDTGIQSRQGQQESSLPEWVTSCVHHRDL